MKDPTKSGTAQIDEAKVRQMHRVLLEAKDKYGNSIVTTDDIYTENDLVTWLDGDTAKLRKFREILISNGKFTADELSGDNIAWTDKYTKKKDQQDSQQSGSNGKSSQDIPTYESEETTDFDLKLYDWDNATEWEKKGLDYNSGVKFNQSKAEMMFEESAPAIKESIDKENNDISNDIAEAKSSYSLDMRDQHKRVTMVPSAIGLPMPIINRHSVSRMHFENLEDGLSDKYNAEGSPR